MLQRNILRSLLLLVLPVALEMRASFTGWKSRVVIGDESSLLLTTSCCSFFIRIDSDIEAFTFSCKESVVVDDIEVVMVFAVVAYFDGSRITVAPAEIKRKVGGIKIMKIMINSHSQNKYIYIYNITFHFNESEIALLNYC